MPKVEEVVYLERELIKKGMKSVQMRWKKKSKLSCVESLNEKWNWGSDYLTSQTAQSLEALASLKSPPNPPY